MFPNSRMVDNYDVEIHIGSDVWVKVGEVNDIHLEKDMIPKNITRKIKQSGSMKYRIVDKNGDLVSQVNLEPGLRMLGEI